MGYATQFPHFAASEIPAAVTAAGWSDASWGNDACPFFIHDASGVGVWVSEALAPMRQHDAMPRFAVVALEWDGQGWVHGIEGDIDLFESDSIDQLTSSLPSFIEPRALAHDFALGLEADLTGQEMTNLREANRTKLADDDSCASHDFCDPNMVMHEAFVTAIGRDPLTGEGGMTEADTALWNAAWDIAKRERLTGKPARAGA